jgi:hypothetical protein
MYVKTLNVSCTIRFGNIPIEIILSRFTPTSYGLIRHFLYKMAIFYGPQEENRVKDNVGP